MLIKMIDDLQAMGCSSSTVPTDADINAVVGLTQFALALLGCSSEAAVKLDAHQSEALRWQLADSQALLLKSSRERSTNAATGALIALGVVGAAVVAVGSYVKSRGAPKPDGHDNELALTS